MYPFDSTIGVGYGSGQGMAAPAGQSTVEFGQNPMNMGIGSLSSTAGNVGNSQQPTALQNGVQQYQQYPSFPQYSMGAPQNTPGMTPFGMDAMGGLPQVTGDMGMMAQPSPMDATGFMPQTTPIEATLAASQAYGLSQTPDYANVLQTSPWAALAEESRKRRNSQPAANALAVAPRYGWGAQPPGRAAGQQMPYRANNFRERAQQLAGGRGLLPRAPMESGIGTLFSAKRGRF